MKKILALVLAALLALTLAGCSGSAEKPAAADNGDSFKVAIVLGVGGLGDESFNDSMYDGCKMAMGADKSITVQVKTTINGGKTVVSSYTIPVGKTLKNA